MSIKQKAKMHTENGIPKKRETHRNGHTKDIPKLKAPKIPRADKSPERVHSMHIKNKKERVSRNTQMGILAERGNYSTESSSQILHI
jgi:hypothetical protein